MPVCIYNMSNSETQVAPSKVYVRWRHGVPLDCVPGRLTLVA